ncbi:Imm8 family immunity protein [Permianibacter aggregans]|uniref:Immunity protein 8 of polymorphic toxin system n=1 Tax=Permianibacter aggregans TaxID=1510150 RepID=A0A4R6UPZ2_9GAMM|nr:Imm8 family immunity protein [Permianibacter aggregans]TDQ49300.1 immunity protein 8 of polymorphic toxin system [Permianibacter aggregans]
MKAVIVSYDCSDHDPIDEWTPTDPFDVDVWINFTIGPTARAGHNYQVRFVTWNNYVADQRFTIPLERYSFSAVLDAVEDILKSNQGSNWEEVSRVLSRYFDWEYDNCQPYPSH